MLGLAGLGQARWKQHRFQTVEMQAATAHAAGVLRHFAQELGMGSSETAKWSAVVERFTNLTMTLWDAKDGWFTDFDLVIQLQPLTYGRVPTTASVQSI